MTNFKELEEGLDGLLQLVKDYKDVEQDEVKKEVYKKALEGLEKVPDEVKNAGWLGMIELAKLVMNKYDQLKDVLK